AAEVLDVLFGGFLAGPQHDARAELLAEPGVRHPDALHVLDFWMLVEELLDLARVDVLAAADDDVLHATDDVAVAPIVDGGEVTGVHPTGSVDRLARAAGVSPVTEHDRVAARQQLSGISARNDPTAAIDHLDLEMRMDAPYRRNAPLQLVVDGALKADR